RSADAAAGLVPRHTADDVPGRLLGAADGGCPARPRLSRPSAVGGARAALRLLDQAAVRARTRGTARASAPAAAQSARPAPARASGPPQRASVLCRYAELRKRGLRQGQQGGSAARGAATGRAATGSRREAWCTGALRSGSAARGAARAATAAPRHRRAGL